MSIDCGRSRSLGRRGSGSRRIGARLPRRERPRTPPGNATDPNVTVEHVNGADTAPHIRVLCRVTPPGQLATSRSTPSSSSRSSTSTSRSTLPTTNPILHRGVCQIVRQIRRIVSRDVWHEPHLRDGSAAGRRRRRVTGGGWLGHGVAIPVMRAWKAFRQKRSGSGGSGLPRSSVHAAPSARARNAVDASEMERPPRRSASASG